MNKNLAIACLALFLASASAQNSTSFCLRNTDCNQAQGLCCSSFAATGSLYTQFNCASHVNGTANIKTQTCMKNATTVNGTLGTADDYTTVCAGQDKTCVNTATKYASCGNSAAMAVIDFFNNQATCTSSGAMSLAASAFFAVLAALALLF